MGIQVTIDITVEILGEDHQTQGPRHIYGQSGTNSPAHVWQHAIQGPTAGSTTPSDNFLTIEPGAGLLFIDPQPVWGAPVSGASFVLKGVTTDVGVAISSYNPSLIGIATSNGGSYVFTPGGGVGASVWNPTAQTDIDLQSSQTLMLQMGWF